MSGKSNYRNYQFGTEYLKKGIGKKSHSHVMKDLLKVVIGLRLQGKTEAEIIKILEGQVE